MQHQPMQELVEENWSDRQRLANELWATKTTTTTTGGSVLLIFHFVCPSGANNDD